MARLAVGALCAWLCLLAVRAHTMYVTIASIIMHCFHLESLSWHESGQPHCMAVAGTRLRDAAASNPNRWLSPDRAICFPA
jgi:hypothetical protein